MRDFIDFVKDIVKDGDKEVYEQNVRDEEVHRHRDGGYPAARDALLVADVHAARGVDVRREHLPVQHEVRLVEYLQITRAGQKKQKQTIK